MEEPDRKKVDEYYDSRDSPANKILHKLKWYHYVVFILFIVACIFFSYKSVINSKFTVDEKATINNAITYFNVSSNETMNIMRKTNESGKFNATPILVLTLGFILAIAYLLTKKAERLLDYHMVVRIVRYALLEETGIDRPFPMGARFYVGPEAKEIEVGTVGLSAMTPSKWVTKVKVHFPNKLIESYLGFVESNTGKFKGLLKVGADELDKAYRDIKIVKPRELWLADSARSAGMKGGMGPYNPYAFFSQPQ